jgi:transcriptional regulator with XRE-family HTH domain
MDAPPYAVRQLAQTLREARLARGLSQRDLAERAHVGQSRLARIEAGAADLRASTLMQLARALDLEVVLAPRQVLPAVQALTERPRKTAEELERRSVRGTPSRVLRHIQQHLEALQGLPVASEVGPELERAKRAAQTLIETVQELPPFTLQPLRRVVHCLATARGNTGNPKSWVAKAAAQLEELRQLLPALAHLERRPQSQRGAYSLEEDELP